MYRKHGTSVDPISFPGFEKYNDQMGSPVRSLFLDYSLQKSCNGRETFWLTFNHEFEIISLFEN